MSLKENSSDVDRSQSCFHNTSYSLVEQSNFNQTVIKINMILQMFQYYEYNFDWCCLPNIIVQMKLYT